MRPNKGDGPPIACFALPGYEPMLSAAGAEPGPVVVERFANGELSVGIEPELDDRRCVLLGSITPPDEQLLALAMAAEALKRHGAAAVLALLPYLAYARQDKEEPGRALGIALVGKLLRAAGVDALVTIDVHSRRAAELIEMPVASLSPAEAFAAELRRRDFLDATVVAPDEGALRRSREVAEAAGISAPPAWLSKERTASGVVHRGLEGEVGRRAVVVDDILDTGGTLISCCRELRRRGVQEAVAMVTHGLFTGETWKEVLPLLAALYVTDSIPAVAADPPDGVSVLSVKPLIEKALAAAADPESVVWTDGGGASGT